MWAIRYLVVGTGGPVQVTWTATACAQGSRLYIGANIFQWERA